MILKDTLMMALLNGLAPVTDAEWVAFRRMTNLDEEGTVRFVGEFNRLFAKRERIAYERGYKRGARSAGTDLH